MNKNRGDTILFSIFLISIIFIILYGMKIITNFYIAAIPVILVTILLYGIYIVKVRKVYIYILIIIASLLIASIFREYTDYEQLILYIIILLSPVAFSVIKWDNKKLTIILVLFSIASLITPIFNGFLTPTLKSGVAFDGRLLPFLYLIFSIIGIKQKSKNVLIRILYYLSFAVNFYGVIWSGSRIALIASIILIVLSFLSNKIQLNDKMKRRLLKLYIAIVVIQLMIPFVYIGLSNNFSEELNNISYNLTNKPFFTGREILWKDIIEDTADYFWIGTSDTDFNNQITTAHNELLGRAYIWGVFNTIIVILYNIFLLRKAIKLMNTNQDKYIIFGMIAIVLCSTFETFMYTPTGFIYYSLLLALLLSKGAKKENEESNSSDTIRSL